MFEQSKHLVSPIKQQLSNEFKSLISTTPVNHSSPIYHSTVSKPTIKPKVNFHSIVDLATSESPKSFNDSGFISSYLNSILMTSSLNSSYNNESNSTLEEKENNESRLLTDSKKLRTTFTDNQKRMLDEYFATNPYPDPKEAEDLSQQLNLPENVIKVWFQNKRSRNKQKKSSVTKRIYPSNNNSPLIANLKLFSSQFNN